MGEYSYPWCMHVSKSGMIACACLSINMGLDAKRQPPRTQSELQTWYQKEVLEDEDYEKKGEFMRQSSWYSILKLICKNEGKWHCKKYHAQKVAKQLVKSPEGKKIVAETASVIKQIDAHRSREQQRAGAHSLKVPDHGRPHRGGAEGSA